jgi:hypothetical protein
VAWYLIVVASLASSAIPTREFPERAWNPSGSFSLPNQLHTAYIRVQYTVNRDLVIVSKDGNDDRRFNIGRSNLLSSKQKLFVMCL